MIVYVSPSYSRHAVTTVIGVADNMLTGMKQADAHAKIQLNWYCPDDIFAWSAMHVDYIYEVHRWEVTK